MRGGHAAQGSGCLLAEAGTRRVEDDEVGREFGGAIGEQGFRSRTNALHVLRNVVAKIGERMRRSFDSEDVIEVACQVMREQSGAGVEVEGGAARLLRHDN